MIEYKIIVEGESVGLTRQGYNATHEFWTGSLKDGRIVLWTIGEADALGDGTFTVEEKVTVYPLGEGPTYLGHK
jgi:hypothetical protein